MLSGISSLRSSSTLSEVYSLRAYRRLHAYNLTRFDAPRSAHVTSWRMKPSTLGERFVEVSELRRLWADTNVQATTRGEEGGGVSSTFSRTLRGCVYAERSGRRIGVEDMLLQ